MNCQDSDEHLGDYVDGTLTGAAVAAVEQHLAVCERCAAVVEDFSALRAMARALPLEMPPPQVWDALSAATGPQQAAAPLRGLRGWQPLAAAAVVALLATGGWWVGVRLAESARPGARADRTPGSDVSFTDTAHATAEAHYTTTIATLEEMAAAERAALDPVTAGAIDSGITVVDDAIEESRAALTSNPDSDVAQESLFQALRRKVALLQQMLALINEMRKGNQDGAARIFSELNP